MLPRVLDLRGGWVVNFTPRQLFSWEKNPPVPIGKGGDQKSRFERDAEENIFSAVLGIELISL